MFEEESYRNEKTSITQFLVDNSVYDCMPINSYVVSVDRDLSMLETVQLMLAEGYEELLIWDRVAVKWSFLFSLADAIRFTLFAVRSLLEHPTLNFMYNSFDKLAEDHIERYGKHNGEPTSTQMEQERESFNGLRGFCVDESLRGRFVAAAQKVTVHEFMLEVYDLHNFSLKTVSMDTKLTAAILKMLSEKIHRIVVEEKGSKMFTSILNYKDILLYLLRSVNEEFSSTNEYNLPFSVLIENRKNRESTIDVQETVWNAFDVMINRNKTVWLNVVDKQGKYVSTLFREDFHLVLAGWRLDLLGMDLRQFIDIKHKEQAASAVPEYRLFRPTETIKAIVQKILTCRRNTLICVDEQDRIEYTIGLSELFNLYIL